MIIKQQFCKIIMNNQSLDKRTTNMLIRQYILFVSLHLTFLFGTIYCTSSLCSYNSPWLIYTNQKLNQAPLEIITGQTALGCSNACFLDDKCTSFNHEPSTGGCELLRGARFKILGDEKQTTTGWNYYLINCQFIVTHVCGRDLCQRKVQEETEILKPSACGRGKPSLKIIRLLQPNIVMMSSHLLQSVLVMWTRMNHQKQRWPLAEYSIDIPHTQDSVAD
ncbi:unnamed protein product [Owenia fusiformis]|uniref:Apple domain-containing protein n=1 Tax=Owenia fusiformis TaxID=6347 RepID=A0A8S4PE89_OWEFU|nr:unnamed protein product [Owenia fusiformis]